MRSEIIKNSDGNSYRSEAVIPGSEKNLEYGRDYWYGFSAYLPPDWQVSYKNELIAQFHSALDPEDVKGIGPPVSIRSGREGDWEVISRREGDVRGRFRHWTLNSVWEDVGRWTDWVIHYKPSTNSQGILRVWKNGALVVEHYGPNAMDDRRGPYFKMGIYAPNWKNKDDSGQQSKVVFHDALRIASGKSARYFDVAPQGVFAEQDQELGGEDPVESANLAKPATTEDAPPASPENSVDELPLELPDVESYFRFRIGAIP